MNNKNVGLGIIFLSIGLIWVLVNMGILNWSIINAAFVLWPLILVMVGINIIFRNNEIIKAVTWIVFLAVFIIYGFFAGGVSIGNNTQLNNNLTIEKKAQTENGEFKLTLGGIKLDIGSGSTNLLDASVTDPDIRQSLHYKNGDKTAVVYYDKKRNVIKFLGNKNNEYCGFNLNEDVNWKIDIKTGAVDGNIDLSRLSVSEMNLAVGAGNLEVVMGSKSPAADIKIDAGASKIDLVFPESAGVRLKMNGALNKTNLDELNWEKSDDYYKSPNYGKSANRIDINVNMGVGQLTVHTK